MAGLSAPGPPGEPAVGSRWVRGPLQVVFVLLLAAAFAAVAFSLAVLLVAPRDLALHEDGGEVLFALLAPAWIVATVRRSACPGVPERASGALAALATAALLGGLLAAGTLPGRLGGLPLLPLAGVVVASLDGARVLARVLWTTGPDRNRRTA